MAEAKGEEVAEAKERTAREQGVFEEVTVGTRVWKDSVVSVW